MPLNVDEWLAQKKQEMAEALKTSGRAASKGLLLHASIEAGALKIDRLPPSVPDGADQLVLDLYAQMSDLLSRQYLHLVGKMRLRFYPS